MPQTTQGIVPVILCGGAGSRLWPLSRETSPKQFLSLDGRYSLLQATVMRVADAGGYASPMVICNQEYRFRVAEQMQSIHVTPRAIILEPFGRNTAPAIALAAQRLVKDGQGESVMLVLPSDHLILETEEFLRRLEIGSELAQAGKLVTFGITPTKPATGFGYIEQGAPLANGAYEVSAFVEKPTRDIAQAFLDGGKHAWNSGMFMFKAATYLEELQKFEPDIVRRTDEAISKAQRDLDFCRVAEEPFAVCPEQSIDYGVMERTSKAAMVPLSITWTDVGNWSSMWEVSAQDAEGNSLHGDVIAIDASDCYVRAEQGRLVAALGVEDLIIVDTADALLVTHRSKAEQVKLLVKRLQREERPEVTQHRRVYRPWGHYDSVAMAPGFQIKRIWVKPGGKLSLQMHHKRSEHWVVVHGTARVTCDAEQFDLPEGESTFIPLGSRHRLENPSPTAALELVEVQVGHYLGEDDIVRFEDIYGREQKVVPLKP